LLPKNPECCIEFRVKTDEDFKKGKKTIVCPQIDDLDKCLLMREIIKITLNVDCNDEQKDKKIKDFRM